MAMTVSEDYASRPLERDENGAKFTRKFTVHGTGDPAEAETADDLPKMWDVYGATLYRVTNVKVEVGHVEETAARCFCRATITYSTPAYQQKNPDKDDDEIQEPEESFDVGTQQTHIVKALAALHYPDTATWPGLAIGASMNDAGETRIEGVDVYAGMISFPITWKRAELDGVYKRMLTRKVAKVNDDFFRDFNAGEVLFAGAACRRRGKGPWIITGNFIVSRTAEIEVELITGTVTVPKKGWQYFWIEYIQRPSPDRTQVIWENKSAHVQDVYESIAFDDLEISE